MAQLSSDSEELHQVVSSILRNLSWRADISTKRVLRDIGCVSALMTCALQATKVIIYILQPGTRHEVTHHLFTVHEGLRKSKTSKT